MSFAAPRKVLFDDLHLQQTVEMVLTLAEELSVTQDRLDSLVDLLERTGALGAGQLEAFRPNPQAEEARAARRRAMLHRLFSGLHDALDQASAEQD